MKSIVFGVVLLLLSPSLFAATRTWTGATDANWNSGANWGGTAPLPGDDLVFPAGALNETNTNNFPVGTSFHSVTLSGDAYTLNGNPILLGAGGITTTGGTTHTINFPITLGAPQTWTLNDATGNSETDVESPSVNLNAKNLVIVGSTSGTILWGSAISGTGSISLQNAFVVLGGISTTLAPVLGNNAIVIVDRNSAYPGPITMTGNIAGAEIGKGSISGPITISATFQGIFVPDETPGGVVGDLKLQSLVLYEEDITDATHFGQVSVNGIVSLGNLVLPGIFTSASIPPGTQLTIVNNDGSDAVLGTFVGAPEGSTLPSINGGATQNFTVSYKGGDGNDIVLTAGPLITTQTNTVVTASVNPVAAGASVTYTATVTPQSGSAIPTGSVTFLQISPGPALAVTTLGTATLNASGVATLTVPAPAIGGDYDVTALYSGAGVFGGSNGGVILTVTGSSAAVPTLDPRVLALLAVVLAALGAFAIRLK